MKNIYYDSEEIIKEINDTKVYIDNKECILNVVLTNERLLLTKTLPNQDTMDAFHGIRTFSPVEVFKSFELSKVEGVIYEEDNNVISIKNKGNIIVFGTDLSEYFLEVIG